MIFSYKLSHTHYRTVMCHVPAVPTPYINCKFRTVNGKLNLYSTVSATHLFQFSALALGFDFYA